MLKALFGQEGAMIESPFLVERDRRMRLMSFQQIIKQQLSAKFGPVPDDVTNTVGTIEKETDLLNLAEKIVKVSSLDEFRAALPK